MATSNGDPNADVGQDFHDKDDQKDQTSNFECNICLDIARDAVVSLCGHLFCCHVFTEFQDQEFQCTRNTRITSIYLHLWLETRPNTQLCPVCKAGISKDKVIPLYGRDNINQKDPREKLPPRPQAQRPEPESNFNPFHAFRFGNTGRFEASFGIGAFPFTFITRTFGNNEAQINQNSPHAQEEQFLSRLFLWIALLFLFWLLLA